MFTGAQSAHKVYAFTKEFIMLNDSVRLHCDNVEFFEKHIYYEA